MWLISFILQEPLKDEFLYIRQETRWVQMCSELVGKRKSQPDYQESDLNHRFNKTITNHKYLYSVWKTNFCSSFCIHAWRFSKYTWALSFQNVIEWYSDELVLPLFFFPFRSWDSSVGIVTGDRVNGQGSIFRRGEKFCLLHSILTSFGAHPTSYPVGTGGSFPGGEATRAWSWPHTSINCWYQEWWSYTSTPHTSSWCGA
jgi:hypothetical protein